MAQLAHLFDDTTLSGGLSYFDYEYQVAGSVLIPWLEKNLDLKGLSVGDFGCHQGGILQALREKASIGSGRGYDLNEDSIRTSPFVQDANFQLEIGDILTLDPAVNQFDLILIRDVLEHIPDYENVLRKAQECLKPGGHLFVSFPPYYSPFGGHQQLASNAFKLVPYLHYLPERLLFNCVSLKDNEYMTAEDSKGDMTSVRHTRLTLGKTEKAFRNTGFQRVAADYFLLRPEFKIRYGIPTLPCAMMGAVPILREIFTMGVYYLVTNPIAKPIQEKKPL